MLNGKKKEEKNHEKNIKYKKWDTKQKWIVATAMTRR